MTAINRVELTRFIEGIWADDETKALRERLRAEKDGFYYEFCLHCDSLEDMVELAMKLMPAAELTRFIALVEAVRDNALD